MLQVVGNTPVILNGNHNENFGTSAYAVLMFTTPKRIPRPSQEIYIILAGNFLILLQQALSCKHGFVAFLIVAHMIYGDNEVVCFCLDFTLFFKFFPSFIMFLQCRFLLSFFLINQIFFPLKMSCLFSVAQITALLICQGPMQ